MFRALFLIVCGAAVMQNSWATTSYYVQNDYGTWFGPNETTMAAACTTPSYSPSNFGVGAWSSSGTGVWTSACTINWAATSGTCPGGSGDPSSCSQSYPSIGSDTCGVGSIGPSCTVTCTAGTNSGPVSGTGGAIPPTTCQGGCTYQNSGTAVGSGGTFYISQSTSDGTSCTAGSGSGSYPAATPVSPAPASPACGPGEAPGSIQLGGSSSVACYPTTPGAGPTTTTTTSSNTTGGSGVGGSGSGSTTTTTTTTTSCTGDGACSVTVTTGSGSSGTTSSGSAAATPTAPGSGVGGVTCGTDDNCNVKVDETGTPTASAAGAANDAVGDGVVGTGGAMDTRIGDIGAIGSTSYPGDGGAGGSVLDPHGVLPPDDAGSCPVSITLFPGFTSDGACTVADISHLLFAWFWGATGVIYLWRRGHDAIQAA